jgi:hypothetical protein
MKAGSREPEQEPGIERESVQREARTCPVCGTKYFATADMEFCPVCVLRGATGGESAATGNRVQHLSWQQLVLRRPMVGCGADGLSIMK